MNKDLLREKYCAYKEQLFPCYMEMEKESFEEYSFGYFYDDLEKKWKVYINKERGIHKIRFIMDSEEEAIEEVNSILDYEIESRGLI